MVDRVEIKSAETGPDAPPKKEDQQPQAQVTNSNPPAKDQAQPQARPDWLPPKFKSAEDLAKAYSELEKKQSAPKDSKAAETAPKSDGLEISAAEKVVADAGLNIDDFTKEYTEKGQLSTESYDKLAAKGLPKALVDAHIAGLQAVQERTVDNLLKDVGGRDGYSKIAEWAQGNVPTAELEAYNRAVTGSDAEVARLALSGLHAKYSKAQEPDLLRAGEASAGSAGVFRSVEQLTQAMRDPRYAKDSAYREDVKNKLARSNIL